ncbi:hypothetical protein LXL04_016738 [Taraxacum kok-saghyz]
MIPSQRRPPGEVDFKEVRETYLVILVLIAAAAYQTALSPPGSYWQEDKFVSLESNYTCASPSPSPPDTFNSGMGKNYTAGTTFDSVVGKNHSAGTSIIGTNKNITGYYMFVICNSLGFFSAIAMIFWLTAEFPKVFVMHSLLVLLSLNYTTCVIMVLPPDYTPLRYICIVMPIIFLIGVITVLINDGKVDYRK